MIGVVAMDARAGWPECVRDSARPLTTIAAIGFGCGWVVLWAWVFRDFESNARVQYATVMIMLPLIIVLAPAMLYSVAQIGIGAVRYFVEVRRRALASEPARTGSDTSAGAPDSVVHIDIT